MLKMIVALCSIVISVSLASAEPIDKPRLKTGDTWAYQSTTEQSANQNAQASGAWAEKHSEITVVRAGSSTMLISRKERGSKLPPLEIMTGSDWSYYRSINGEETVVNQPFNFPLEEGKSWNLKFIENHPNNQLKYLESQLNYTVVGWEEVTVPAGKFKALKIETDGKWKSELEPSNNTSTSSRTNQDGTTVIMQANKERPKVSSGRIYRAYWYVPEAKRYVKAVEENFTPNGTLSRRNTEELESFKVAQ